MDHASGKPSSPRPRLVEAVATIALTVGAIVLAAVAAGDTAGSSGRHRWYIGGAVACAAGAGALVVMRASRNRRTLQTTLDAIGSGSKEASLVVNGDIIERGFGATEDVFGLAAGDLVGRSLVDLLGLSANGLDSLRRRAGALRGTSVTDGPYAFLNLAGVSRTVDLTLTERRDRALRATLVTVHNRTTEHELREQLARQAAANPSTNLPNPARFRELLTLAVHRSRRSGEHLAVLSILVDNVDSVRHALGESHVERMLAEVGSRLQLTLRAEDLIGHVGSNEFGIALEGLAPKIGRAYAVDVADRLVAAMSEPIVVDGSPMHLDITVGIAHRSRGVADPTAAELIADAHAAMLEVKANARRWSDLRATP